MTDVCHTAQPTKDSQQKYQMWQKQASYGMGVRLSFPFCKEDSGVRESLKLVGQWDAKASQTSRTLFPLYAAPQRRRSKAGVGQAHG